MDTGLQSLAVHNYLICSPAPCPMCGDMRNAQPKQWEDLAKGIQWVCGGKRCDYVWRTPRPKFSDIPRDGVFLPFVVYISMPGERLEPPEGVVPGKARSRL
jgi:hypothetical protein